MGQTIDTFKHSEKKPQNTFKQDSLTAAADRLKHSKPDSDTTLVKDTLTVSTDTTAVKDTAKIFRRMLVPKNQIPLGPANNLNYIIDKEQILFNDYRFSGELLDRLPFSFIRNLQTLGQPHEVIIYGAGFNEVSYMKDGLFLNNRLTNSFDLNNVQSESIDSIEVIPSPRGFLYGAFNNQASVNFISRETISLKERGAQYSRLKYYQAQNEEAMVDFIYISNWFRRITSTLEITNKTYNDPQTPVPANSDYSLWNGTLKLKYLLSNSFNIIGSYNYIKSDVGLYGGLTEQYLVNDTTLNQGIDLTQADVYYTNRHNKNTFHNVVLQLLGNPFPNSTTDLKAYYRFNLMEFRQNENDTSANIQTINDNNRSKLYGISLRQTLNSELLFLDLNTTFELNDFRTNILLPAEMRINAFSFGGSAGLKLLDSSLIPSVFGKYLDYSGKSYPGFGVDLLYRYSQALQFYAGMSQYRQPFNPIEEQFLSNVLRAEVNSGPGLKQLGAQLFITEVFDYKKVDAFEAGVRFNYKDLNNSLFIFSRDISGDPLVLIGPAEVNKYSSFQDILLSNKSHWGIGVSGNFRLWRLYLESSGAYYYNDRNNNISYKMPEYTFRGGIYYRDTLFNANLHLKAGIYAQYNGAQSFYSYDFEREMRAVAYGNGQLNVPTASPSFQLDFRLVGQVQQRAILYLTVDNIFDNKYYIIPYYINPGRNFRIGISWEFLK